MQATDDEIWAAFCEVIDEKDRDDILTSMSEAAHDRRYESDVVKITNRTRHNAINVTVEGEVTYKEKSYYFHLEDGDWNGTVLRGWEDTGTEWEEYHAPEMAIMPQDHLIAQALNGDNPAFLLQKWELFEKRPDVAQLIRSYGYDSYFAPGVKTETHYRSKMDELKIQIVTKDEADQAKQRLRQAAET